MDWTAVKSMLLAGVRDKKGGSSQDVVYEDQLYLSSQGGSMRLDKFTHTLLVKCNVEVSDNTKFVNLMLSLGDNIGFIRFNDTDL